MQQPRGHLLSSILVLQAPRATRVGMQSDQPDSTVIILPWCITSYMCKIELTSLSRAYDLRAMTRERLSMKRARCCIQEALQNGSDGDGTNEVVGPQQEMR